jgi:hypothetical protein
MIQQVQCSPYVFTDRKYAELGQGNPETGGTLTCLEIYGFVHTSYMMFLWNHNNILTMSKNTSSADIKEQLDGLHIKLKSTGEVIEELFKRQISLELTKKNIFCNMSNRFSSIHNTWFLFTLLAIVAIALAAAKWTIVNAQNETSIPLSTPELIQASIQSWMAVALGVASLIGVALKFIETYAKNHTNDTRFIKLAEVLRKTKDSIEESDKAIKDNADLYQLIVNNIANIPEVKAWFEKPENKALIEKANKNADEMAESMKQYYQVSSRKAGDNSRDYIVRMLAETEKELVPG